MTTRIDDLFGSLQERLQASLKVARAVIGHPGTKGDACEGDWVGMLGMHLPARYSVSKAFVVDCDGAISDQLDVVIYDRQYSPLLFQHGTCLYIPAESVYGVMEVKQDLTREHVLYAGEKIASVRRLRRTSTAITHAGGTFKPREPIPILGGLLATTSGWTPGIGAPLVAALADLPRGHEIDVGCALDAGGFEVGWTDAGLGPVNASDAPHALVWFFLRLLTRLQALGTVPAMDIGEYAHHAGTPRLLNPKDP
ncbi:MAG: hypothetical protein Q8P41_27585 [Pseudomonadota bacterium]|nr:hypothetical protein [Pseudomonadota bacterium]